MTRPPRIAIAPQAPDQAAGKRPAKPSRLPPGPQPWRWRTLLNAPHRLGFFGGACVMTTAALWWALVLVSRLGTAWALPQAVPPMLVHAAVMVLGFMPLFFTGFLFTAGPRWLQLPEQTAPPLLAPVAACVLGWALLLAGGMVSAALAGGGVLLASGAWAVLAQRFNALRRGSRAQDRLHAGVVAASCLVGAAAMAVAGGALLLNQAQWLRAAVQVGLWCFIVPVYITVAHRMLPFFTAHVIPFLDAWRPNWLLWALLALSWGQAALWLADQRWAGAGWVLGAHVLVSGTGGLGVLALSWRWGLLQSLKIRLLAMLHLGFFWLGVGLALDAASAALQWLSAGQTSLGLAPLHAVTMGFLGGILIAMVTRVSCGHGGRTLAADSIAWSLFWLLQVAVVLRLLAALWAAPAASGAATPAAVLAAAAAIAWLAAVGAWTARYARWWGRPRVDGRPG